MRRTKLYPGALLLAGVLSPTAHAQLVDTRPTKPVMMLLVDTSGSMERMPDATSNSPPVSPDCRENATNDANQKNRWAITLEALTGSLPLNFTCKTVARTSYPADGSQYDRDYFLPHFEYSFAPDATGGVLDSYKNRLKFGLMTFDGVPTTISSDTLVPFTPGPVPIIGSVYTMAGMYSYPTVISGTVPFAQRATLDTPSDAHGSPPYGWKPLAFEGCSTTYGINAGAREKGSLPGSLVSVGHSNDESTATLNGINDTIQSSLLKVRPFGGTPIAGMLDDLRYYMNNDLDVMQGLLGDKYYQCRKRYAILLTDGAPDLLFRNDPRFKCNNESDDTKCGPDKVCQCPYDTEENIVLKLKAQNLHKLWVVAFNVADATALLALDKIALAGSEEKALRAPTATALRTELDRLMSLASPEATSRSVPVVTNTGRPMMLGGSQFEISAGFQVGQADDEPWQGFLYRRRTECSGANAAAQTLDSTKGDMFHVTLNARAGTDRAIMTVIPTLGYASGSVFGVALSGTPGVAVANRTNLIGPTGSAFSPVYGELPLATLPALQPHDYNVQHATLKDFTTNDSITPPAHFGGSSARNKIHHYLRGIPDPLGVDRSGRKLGDIYHSNPVVLPPMRTGSELLNKFDPQLRAFYTDLLKTTGTPAYGAEGRPGVVFVGTNDGLLHAFNLDKWRDKSNVEHVAGKEFWGFVPPSLFSNLASTAIPTHQWMFDGTPVVKDMIINRAGTGTPTIKTILLAAVRGAPSYIALDVTNPELPPKFLWQRTFQFLGNTVATPALAQVRMTWKSVTNQLRAVAILPGGEGQQKTTPSTACNIAYDVRQFAANKSGTDRTQVRCWEKKGRSLYVVDVETGELIQEFDGRHFHSPMSGSVSVDGEGLATSRAAYMTDEDGILWRLSMMGTDPTLWRVQPMWDLYAGKARGFGGSEVLAPTPSWSAGRVAPYAPLITRNPLTGNLTIIVGTGDVDSLDDAKPNRIVSLEERRPMNGQELEAATSSNLTANWNLQLDAGEAVTGPPVILDQTVYFTTFKGPGGSSSPNPCDLGTNRVVGAHVRKQASTGLPEPMLMPENGVPPLVLQYSPTSTPNSLLLGLSIARDPVCVAGSVDNDPLVPANAQRITTTGATGGGQFQMRAMVAGGGGSVIPGSSSTGPGQRQFSRTLPVPNIARSVGWASSIE